MSLKEIKKVLYEYYEIEDTDDEIGCFINGKWLSIKNIIDLLNAVAS